MRSRQLFIIAALSLLAAGCCSENDAKNLRAVFADPPQSAKPMVWWHWMNGNITKEGVRKDILWMHSVGIGGFHVFDAGLDCPQLVEKRLDWMSPEWKEALYEAVSLADSLGMEVAIAASPGWSCTGGPWVEAKDAMKKLSWRYLQVEGGKHFNGALPEAFSVSSRFQNVPLPYEYNHHQDGPIEESYYQDIAVYAVKLPESYASLEELGAKVSASGGEFDVRTLIDGDLTNAGFLPSGPDGYAWIQYEFPEPQSFKAVTIVNATARSGGHGASAKSKDSLLVSNDGINFTTLCGINQGSAQQQTEAIPYAEARFWRLKHKNPESSYHYGKLVRQCDDGSEIGDFVLHKNIPVNHAEEKAGFGYVCYLPSFPTAEDAEPSEVIDISENFKDGILDWEVPEGRWMIYRFGCSLTGKKNHPASAEATGLEVDKLDKDAFERYLRHYLDLYKDATKGLVGKHGIQYLMIDSYESGAQNWTETLPAEFKARRGYDMMPWLPAVAGVIIGSTEQTEKFLFDLRTTVGELFAENYDNASAVTRNEYGMKGVFIESHEHGRNCPSDGISIKKSAAYPMSAMWLTGETNVNRLAEGRSDILESASTAHIYGQNLVAAESFTISGANLRAFTYYPGNLKRAADLEMGAGVNRFVVHESAHQPVDDKVPGIGLGSYGQWFQRHDTWAYEAGPWVKYLSRSCAMLQQGTYVADWLYYYGEDTNITARYSKENITTPFGYGFDFAGPEVLLKEIRIRKGKLVTKSGMSYSALYVGDEGLPRSEEISEKIAAIKAAGIPVYEGGEFDEAVSGIEADLILDDNSDMQFVHRRTRSADIYWIDNLKDSYREIEASFRISGHKPRLWQPERGEITDLPYRFENGRTVIPLCFLNDEAYFVVFEEKTTENSLDLPKTVFVGHTALDGPWSSTLGDFPELKSWSESPVDSIRYFSGTAEYEKTFNFTPGDTGRYILDLGKVGCIASVCLNGKDLGQLWKFPYFIDVTDALVPGNNLLKVKVTNLWVNRLIGDAGKADRKTYFTWEFYQPGDPLLPSGLIGPVSIDLYVEQK